MLQQPQPPAKLMYTRRETQGPDYNDCNAKILIYTHYDRNAENIQSIHTDYDCNAKNLHMTATLRPKTIMTTTPRPFSLYTQTMTATPRTFI